MDFTKEIAGYTLEYIDDTHTYLIDGVIVPSITQIIKAQMPNKYSGVSREVLNMAAQKGTEVHQAIEDYCTQGKESDLPEVRNFKFLQRQYGFKVIENETPVIIFHDGKPVGAGRLDLVLEIDGKTGGADIKRTSTLDKEYLAYQLNLYRMAYQQSYGVKWEFLRGIHLRENVRKFVDIPINEPMAYAMLNDFMKGKENGD